VVGLTSWGMPRKHSLIGFLSLLLAAHLEARPDRDIIRDARRHYLVEHIRIAATDRLIERPDEIAAYLDANFNTVVLYDTEGNGPLKSEERIAFELAFARAHGLHVLIGKATELAPQVSDAEIRERLSLWDRWGSDVILGVFFLHDDACLIETSVERQRHLYAIAHDTVPDWYVFGMIGEFCDARSDSAYYFDPNAFDHLIMLMYPLSLSEVTGTHLDSATSADPDEDMRRYVHGYIERMGEKFISHLRPGQVVLLVIQSFAYYNDDAGHVPRPSDVDIQATVGNASLRAIAGQAQNQSIAYYLWDGSRAGMFGLWQRTDWMAAAVRSNDQIERGLRPIDRQAP